MIGEDGNQIPVVLYPSQIWVAEAQGWVRGKDFIVYKCLTCIEDMDRCKCSKVVDLARRRK